MEWWKWKTLPRCASASRWARGLRPVPDVAHSSWEVPEGTGVGESRNPSDPASYGLDPKTATLKLKFRVTSSAAAAYGGGDNNCSSSGDGRGPGILGWDAVLWRQRLYVSVTPMALSNGSKEAFVSLLEYAEDVLEVTHVIVCFGRGAGGKRAGMSSVQPATAAASSPDEAKAIRNFMFLGFQPLAPGHEFMPSNPNLVCFYYTI